MFDELRPLRDVPHLLHLLEHYASLGAADREAWQDRLMELESVAAKDLSRLHGELIAGGWIEMNLNSTGSGKGKPVPGCYRVTSSGHRALKRVQSQWPEEQNGAEAA